MKTTLTGLIPRVLRLCGGGVSPRGDDWAQAQALAANGVTARSFAGTPGEGLSLTTAERRQWLRNGWRPPACVARH